ncbi:UNVERIFIED_CONTAM: Flavonoid 3'-monooxygenase [Sesamum calycinum]|uniref:Flavonoid 3'-monooxygenase n=1 Tax=Sesamum calycinum TaxID=2727403 RepID=A0AAW2J4N3_9LAMI
MAELLNHKEKLHKVQKELSDIIGLSTVAEESHLPKLRYLDAVVKETLRLHPAVPLLLPRRPSQSCVVGGYTIPKHTTVFLNVWSIQRDPSLWDNPLEFNPERFLNGTDQEWDFHGNNFQYAPFGSGRRVCAGVALAERTLMYILASLLHSFEWRLPDGEDVDMTEKLGLVLRKSTPLIAIPTPRLCCEGLPGNVQCLVHKDGAQSFEKNSSLATRATGLAHPWILAVLGNNLVHKFGELADQYGPIYKLYLGNKLCVVVNSPSLVKEVVRDQDSIFANRDSNIAALAATYDGNDIAFSPHNSQWRAMRKVFVREVLSNSSLQASYDLRKDEVRKAIRDVYNDIGKPVHFGEEARRVGEEFQEVVIKLVDLLGKPNAADLFPVLAWFDIQGVKKEMEGYMQSMDQIFEYVIAKCRKMTGGIKKEGKKDFLQVMLELHEKEDSEMSISVRQIKAVLVDIVAGGTDTTATTIEWAMAELLNNPKAMTYVQNELSEVVD